MMKIPRVQNAFPTVSIPSEYNKFPNDTVPKIKPQIGICFLFSLHLYYNHLITICKIILLNTNYKYY
jgi:5-methylcytosine-specific restriction endonuclease McrBC regulatory subunit McrC